MGKRVRGFGFDQALRLMRQGEVVGRLAKDRLFRIVSGRGVGRSAFATVGLDRIAMAYGFGAVPLNWDLYVELHGDDLLASDWVREADWRREAAKRLAAENEAKTIYAGEPKPAVPAKLYGEAGQTKGQTSAAVAQASKSIKTLDKSAITPTRTVRFKARRK